MTEGTVRLSEFSAVTGRPRETIRNLTKAGQLPWDEDKMEGQQRRYNGAHALDMVIAEMLNAQGVTLSEANSCLRAQRAATSEFLYRAEAGLECQPTFIMGAWIGEEDKEGPWAGTIRWIGYDLAMTGSKEEVLSAFRSIISGVGHEGVRSRVIAGPRIVIQSVNEAYRILQERAAHHGFVVHGREITKADRG